MRPLRTRPEEARARLGIPWEVLERDCILSWILAGICAVDRLRDTLVFRGGTALKKCYFGSYRLSEDLDFSGVGQLPTGEAMEKAIRQACRAAVELLDHYAPVEITCERYTERVLHPGGQAAFTVRAKLPWQRTPLTRVMVETALDEKILLATSVSEMYVAAGSKPRSDRRSSPSVSDRGKQQAWRFRKRTMAAYGSGGPAVPVGYGGSTEAEAKVEQMRKSCFWMGSNVAIAAELISDRGWLRGLFGMRSGTVTPWPVRAAG